MPGNEFPFTERTASELITYIQTHGAGTTLGGEVQLMETLKHRRAQESSHYERSTAAAVVRKLEITYRGHVQPFMAGAPIMQTHVHSPKS